MDLTIFVKDKGGNSTYSRLEAEVIANKDKKWWHPVTDSSLTYGDLRDLYSLIMWLRGVPMGIENCETRKE